MSGTQSTHEASEVCFGPCEGCGEGLTVTLPQRSPTPRKLSAAFHAEYTAVRIHGTYFFYCMITSSQSRYWPVVHRSGSNLVLEEPALIELAMVGCVLLSLAIFG